MSNDHQAANAEAALNIPPSNESQNIGLSEFINSRRKSAEPPQEEAPEVVDEESTEEEVTSPPEEEAETAEHEGIADEDNSDFDADSVLLQLEHLSPEERKKLQDRSVQRYGELTARAKAAEAELARLKSEKAENPFHDEPIEDNPFSNLNSYEELEKEARNLKGIERWADDLLWEHSSADPDDVVFTDPDSGREYTKKQIRQSKLNARDGIDKFLPARLKDIRQTELAKQQEQIINQQLSTQISWISDEESETYKAYQKTLADPTIDEIREKVPKIAPQLNAILAHAINSLSGELAKGKAKSVVSDKKLAPIKKKPPSNPPLGSSQRPLQSDEKIAKQVKELEARYHKTGSIDDFKALRAIKHANR